MIMMVWYCILAREPYSKTEMLTNWFQEKSVISLCGWKCIGINCIEMADAHKMNSSNLFRSTMDWTRKRMKFTLKRFSHCTHSSHILKLYDKELFFFDFWISTDPIECYKISVQIYRLNRRHHEWSFYFLCSQYLRNTNNFNISNIWTELHSFSSIEIQCLSNAFQLTI